MAAAVFMGATGSALRAAAADDTVNATLDNSWDPPSVTVNVGDTVTWKNPPGGLHNIVLRQGSNPPLMSEPDGGPSTSWDAAGYPYQFTAAGSYGFLCQQHAGMTGTVTVNDVSSTSTATSTATASATASATNTATATASSTPTATATATPVAPRFIGKVKRRAGRTALVVVVHASTDADLLATVERRAPGARRFRKVGRTIRRAVREGLNRVTLLRPPRRQRLRSGRYRVTLALEDAAGLRSASRTLRFKLAGG